MEEKIVAVLKYFRQFQYPPTLDEIWTFLEKKVNRKKLEKLLLGMVKRRTMVVRKFISHSGKKVNTLLIQNQAKEDSGVVPTLRSGLPRMTNLRFSLPRDKFFAIYKRRSMTSLQKVQKITLYCRLLKLFPQIRLIGLSGTVAMNNAEKKDDIDLFIITAKNRLFTGRLIAIVIGYLLNVKRKFGDTQTTDKVCLNLFFDEKNMTVPKFKQTLYVAHEVIQMKPAVVKGNIYEEFLEKNMWIYKIFPNVKSKVQMSNFKSNPKFKVQKFGFWILNLICHLDFVIWISNLQEYILKKIQLLIINRHRTSELISNSQLWFFPDDFEKKIT